MCESGGWRVSRMALYKDSLTNRKVVSGFNELLSKLGTDTMSSSPQTISQSLQAGEATSEIKDYTTKVIVFGISIIIIVVGTFGNGFVIYVFGWARRKGRPVVEFIFLLLAITDLICCLIAAPIQAYNVAVPADERKQVGLIIKQYFIPVFWPMSFLMSQGLLVIICVDRYRAVVYPFKERIRPKVIGMLYLGLFLLGFAVYFPFVIIFNSKEKTKSVVTGTNHTGTNHMGNSDSRKQSLVKNKAIYFSRSVIELSRDLIGLGIMTVLIYKMLRSLKESEKGLEGSHQEGYIENRNRSVRKTLVIVIAVFTICVLPFDVLSFALGIRVFLFGQPPYSHVKVLAKAFLYLRTLQIANCSANVFVYSFMHPTFATYRSAFIRRICYGFECCHEDEPRDSELQPIKQSSAAPSPALTRSYVLPGTPEMSQNRIGGDYRRPDVYKLK